jgi:hypothetical protein
MSNLLCVRPHRHRRFYAVPQPSLSDIGSGFPLLARLTDRDLFSLCTYVAGRSPYDALGIAVRLEISKRAGWAVTAASGGNGR